MPVRESSSLPALGRDTAKKNTIRSPGGESLGTSSTILPQLSKCDRKVSGSTDLANRTSKVRVKLLLNHPVAFRESSDVQVSLQPSEAAADDELDLSKTTECIGIVSATQDTTLSWLRVHMAQTPSLSSVPAAYSFIPPTTKSTEFGDDNVAPVTDAQEYALTLNSYIPEDRNEERLLDPVFESETKFLLSAATSGNQAGYGDFETLVKVLCDPDTGLVPVKILDKMFKQARRAKANQKQVKRGKDLMQRLSGFLKHRRMSVDQWFAMMDSSGEAAANGTITSRELKMGMKQLCAKAGKEGGRAGKGGGLASSVASDIDLTEDEITTLLRFMDPSGDGDLRIEEVKNAFEKAQATRPNERLLSYAEKVLRGLDLLMKKRGIKTCEWFEWMDLTNSGVVMVDELREGYAVIIDPSAHSLPKRQQRDMERRAARLRKYQNQPISVEVNIIEAPAIVVGADPSSSAAFSTELTTAATSSVLVVADAPNGVPPDPRDPECEEVSSRYELLMTSDDEIENLVDAFLRFPNSRHDVESFFDFSESVATNPGSVHRDIQRVAISIGNLVKRLEEEWRRRDNNVEGSSIEMPSVTSTISRNALLSIVDFLDRKKRGTINIVDLRELFELSVLPRTPEKSVVDTAPVPSRLAERGLEILAKENELGKELDDLLERGEIEAAANSTQGLKGELEFAIREFFRDVDINSDGCIRVKVLEDHFRRARKLKETDKIRAHGRIVARRINSLLLYVNTSCAAWVKRAGPGQTIAGRADLDQALTFLVRLTIDRRKMDNDASRAEHKRILKEAQLAASKVTINTFGQIEKGRAVDAGLLNSKPTLLDETVPPFKKTDIAALMCFIDPTLGTPIITPDKLSTALLLASRNLQATERSRLISAELRLAEFLWRIESLMNENNIRFVDMFGSTASGVINSIGIADSLMRMIEPSEKRAEEFSKRAKAAAIDAELERKQYEREASYQKKRHKEREARRREAETLGVAAVIRALHNQMEANEVDIPGLLRLLDRNGNRHVTSEELVQGLSKASGPNAAYRAEQLRRAKVEANQRRVESKQQKKLQAMQSSMIEVERSGAAVAMKLIIDLSRRSGASVEDLFESEDLLLDGQTRFISSTALCEGLWQAGYAAKASDVETMIKYFDDNDVMAVGVKRLGDVLEAYKHQQAACGLAQALYDKYRDLGDIFFSRNVFADGRLCRKELIDGLKRLRGDPSPQLWKTRLTWNEGNIEDHQRAIRKLFNFTRENFVNLLKLFGVADKHQRIPRENFGAWLKSLKAMKVNLPSEEQVVPSPRADEDDKNETNQTDEDPLDDALLTDHDLAKIMVFLDPEYRDEIVPAMFLDALLLSVTVLQPLDTDPSLVKAGRMMRQVFLSANSEARLEHTSIYDIFADNSEKFKAAGIGELSDPGILLLSVGTTLTRAFDASGFAASFALGTSIFSQDALEDLKRTLLSVNPNGYNLTVLIDSIGYLVEKTEPQVVPLLSVVDRMPAGLAGPAVKTCRGLSDILGQLIASPPVVWNGSKDPSTHEYTWPQLQSDLGATIAIGHPVAETIVPGLDINKNPLVLWDGISFRVFAMGQVAVSRSLDVRVEILGHDRHIDDIKLREAVQSIGEVVRNVTDVSMNTAVLLVQSGLARDLALSKLERSMRPSPTASAEALEDAPAVEDGDESGDGEGIEREECALAPDDVISFVGYIVPSTPDGLIGPEEFVRAFRRHRREKVMAQAAQEARLVLRRVRYAIEAKKTRLEQWIRMMGEGTIIGDLRRFTLMHLTAGLRHLSEKGPGIRFSRNDAVVIIRYIENEQGEGYFTKDTLLQALESTGSDEEQEETKQRIFEQFEFYLKAKNLDVRRMSYVLSLSNESKVAPEQLIRTLEGIMSVGGNPLVAQEQRSKTSKVVQISETEVQQQLRIRHELFNQLEQTEALEPFQKTIALLHRRGRRPHALLESLDEKMMRRGKTVTTVTRAELIEVVRQSTQPLNQARRFLRKGAKDAGTNPIKESNEYVERMTELTQCGVAKVATSLDDYIRRAPGGFEGVFSFVGPKRSDEELSRDSRALASSSWRMSPDELDLALKQLKLKLTKGDIRKLIGCLAQSEAVSKKKKKKKYIYLQDLKVLLKDVRKWKWLQEQEKKPLFSTRELQLVLNYICPEIDVSIREIRLVLQQCKNKTKKVEREVELHPPSPRPETPVSDGPIEVIFLIGGPSSGKSTQSKLLAEDLGYTFLAQRRDIAEDTESAVRHRYVPPEVICHLLREQMKANVLESGSKGFVIEGFPSDRKSAAAWSALNGDIAVVRGVIVLDCAIDLMVARCKSRNILPAKTNERIRNWRVHTEQELTAIGNIFRTDVMTADEGIDAVAAAILAVFKESDAAEEKQEADLQSRLLSMTHRPGTAPVSFDDTANMSETNDLRRRLVEKDAELFMLRKMLEEKEAQNQEQAAVGQYSIRMRVIAASNLFDLGDDCRPYCSLGIVKVSTGEPVGNLKFRSNQIKSSLRCHRLDPVWNEPDYFSWEVPELDVSASVNIYGGDVDDFTQKHQPIGGAMIPVSLGKEDKWFFLSSIDEMDRQATGSVHVQIICSKVAINECSAEIKGA